MMQLHQQENSVAADAAITANINPNLPIHLQQHQHQQQINSTATVKQPILATTSAAANSNRQKQLASTNNTSSSTEQQQQQSAQKCPRCDSTNTKFCYYNNYSLSQPRHFCKNCRRYWTKGGSLRNVPVGGGCRKNKRVKQRSPLEAAAASLVAESEIPAPGTASALLASCMNGGLGGGHLGSISHLPSMMDASGLPCSVSGGLFTLPAFSGPFDPAFVSPFQKAGQPDAAISPFLFQHHGNADFSQFFDTNSGIPTLDHLSAFSPNPNPNLTPTQFFHHQQLPLDNGSSKDHQWQQQQHNSTSASAVSDQSLMFHMHNQHHPHHNHVDSNSSATMWNASWPEMHAALANGTSSAGFFLHHHHHQDS